MGPTTDQRRRRILQAAGVAAAGLAVLELSFGSDDAVTTGPSDTTARPNSTGVARPADAAGVEAVGWAYLAHVPEEADVGVLRAALPELGAGDAIETTGLLSTLGARARADFAGADTVEVDGWVLARTEARGAALVALLSV